MRSPSRRRQAPPLPAMIPVQPGLPRAGRPRSRNSSWSLRKGPSHAGRTSPSPLPPRSPRRESGAAAQASVVRRGARRRPPALAARPPDGVAEAPEVGAALAPDRLLRLVLLVAADLPLPDAAGV